MKETNTKKSKSSSIWTDHGPILGIDRRIFIWAIILIVAVSIWAFLNTQISSWVSSLLYPDIKLNLPKGTQLLLSPQTSSEKVGDTFAVDVILNTANTPIDGVDIYTLHYDPSLLKVIDDVPQKPGTQILPGTILPVNAANIVEEKTGSIKFSQVSQGGGSFSGRGILATIHFKALNFGTAYLKFDFNQGSTVDTNTAWRGKDKLSKVVDGIYTISKK